MTQENLKRLQLKRLKALLNHVYNNVPFYHKLYKETNIMPDNIKELSAVKKLNKEDKREIDKRSCLQIKRHTFVNSTSGNLRF